MELPVGVTAPSWIWGDDGARAGPGPATVFVIGRSEIWGDEGARAGPDGFAAGAGGVAAAAGDAGRSTAAGDAERMDCGSTPVPISVPELTRWPRTPGVPAPVAEATRPGAGLGDDPTDAVPVTAGAPPVLGMTGDAAAAPSTAAAAEETAGDTAAALGAAAAPAGFAPAGFAPAAFVAVAFDAALGARAAESPAWSASLASSDGSRDAGAGCG